MPKMSKHQKEEWSFFLNEKGRRTYNVLCRRCVRDCKQSFRVAVIQCPKYRSKRAVGEVIAETADDSARQILFPNKADAIVFNQWIYDWSGSGNAEKEEYGDTANEIIDNQLSNELRALRFLLENMMNYRHVSVKGLKTYDDPADDAVRRNRIVCYADNVGFDDLALIEKQIADENNSEVSLVSFENECILSVYDDRGCDIVFSTYEKMQEFYHLLEPFFLKYDCEIMKKRFEQGN